MADDLLLKIGADASGVQKGVSQATSSLDTLSADATKTSKNLAALGTQKVAPSVSITVKDQAIAKAKADIAKLRDDVARGLTMGTDTRPAQRRIAELQRSLRSLEDKPHVVKINVDEKDSTTRLVRVNSAMGSLSLTAAALKGTVATAFVTAVGSVVKLSADMETLKSRFASVVGTSKQAQAAFDDIRRFADSTPFEFPDLVSATTTLASFGVKTEDLIGTLKGLGEAAASSGASLQDVALIYGQMLARGKLTAEDALQLTSRGIDLYGALAKVLGTTKEQAQKLGEEGKITRRELEQLPTALRQLYSGAIERQAATFNGQMSTLADNVKAVGINIGNTLLPELTDLAAHLNALNLPKVSEGLGDVIEKARKWNTIPLGEAPGTKEIEKKLADQKKAADDLARSTQDAADAAGMLKQANHGLIIPTKSLADAYADAKSKLDSLVDSIDVFNGKGKTAEEQQIAYKQAISDANDALKETEKNVRGHAAALDINTQRGRDNRQALADVAKSIGDMTNKRMHDAIASGQSTTTIVADYNRMRESLIKQTEKFTGSRRAAEEYVNKLLDTPEEVKTAVKVTGVAEAEKQLDKVTQDREVQVRLSLSISKRVQNEFNKLGISPYGLPAPTPAPPVPSGQNLQVGSPTPPNGIASRGQPPQASVAGVMPQGTVGGLPINFGLVSPSPQVIIHVSDKRLADLVTVAVRDAVSGSLRVLNSRQVVQAS